MRCTCGRAEDASILHGVTCLLVAAGQPHAMVTDTGDVFYPDSEDDARDFAEGHDAWPLRPDVFPFDLGGCQR